MRRRSLGNPLGNRFGARFRLRGNQSDAQPSTCHSGGTAPCTGSTPIELLALLSIDPSLADWVARTPDLRRCFEISLARGGRGSVRDAGGGPVRIFDFEWKMGSFWPVAERRKLTLLTLAARTEPRLPAGHDKTTIRQSRKRQDCDIRILNCLRSGIGEFAPIPNAGAISCLTVEKLAAIADFSQEFS